MLLDCSHLPPEQINDAMELLCKGVEDRMVWDPHPTDRLIGAVEDQSATWMVQALTRILGEAMHVLVSGRSVLAKAQSDERQAESVNFRCKELAKRAREADPGSLELAVYLEMIDCWLMKFLPPAIAEQTAKRRAIQQYLAGFLRRDIMQGKAAAPSTPEAARAMAAKIPESLSGARSRWTLTGRDEGRLRVAQASAGRYIQNISHEVRSRLAKVVIDAERQRIADGARAFDHQPLSQALQDQFAELNMDYRRIAVTETAINASDGMLATTSPGELVQWLAHPGACRYCQSQDGRVFTVVAPDAPRKDPETQVWAGKHVLNVGRAVAKRKRMPDGSLVDRDANELVVPAIPGHPHCRCLYAPFVATASGAESAR